MAETLASKLLKLDRNKLAEVPTVTIKAKRLSKVMGEDTFVTLKALPGDLYMDISERSQEKNGHVSTSKAYDSQALIVAYGCIDPDLKSKELQEYFQAPTAKDLAKVFFPGGELSYLANKIAVLSGFLKPEDIGDEPEPENKNTGLDYDSVKN